MRSEMMVEEAPTNTTTAPRIHWSAAALSKVAPTRGLPRTGKLATPKALLHEVLSSVVNDDTLRWMRAGIERCEVGCRPQFERILERIVKRDSKLFDVETEGAFGAVVGLSDTLVDFWAASADVAFALDALEKSMYFEGKTDQKKSSEINPPGLMIRKGSGSPTRGRGIFGFETSAYYLVRRADPDKRERGWNSIRTHAATADESTYARVRGAAERLRREFPHLARDIAFAFPREGWADEEVETFLAAAGKRSFTDRWSILPLVSSITRLDLLERLVADTEDAARYFSCFAHTMLHNIGPEAVRILVRLFHTAPNAAVRKELAEAISIVEDPVVAEALLSRLGDRAVQALAHAYAERFPAMAEPALTRLAATGKHEAARLMLASLAPGPVTDHAAGPEAPVDALPPILVDPPWKRPASRKPVTVKGLQILSAPESIQWHADEESTYAWRPPSNSPRHAWQDMLALGAVIFREGCGQAGWTLEPLDEWGLWNADEWKHVERWHKRFEGMWRDGEEADAKCVRAVWTKASQIALAPLDAPLEAASSDLWSLYLIALLCDDRAQPLIIVELPSGAAVPPPWKALEKVRGMQDSGEMKLIGTENGLQLGFAISCYGGRLRDLCDDMKHVVSAVKYLPKGSVLELATPGHRFRGPVAVSGWTITHASSPAVRESLNAALTLCRSLQTDAPIDAGSEDVARRVMQIAAAHPGIKETRPVLDGRFVRAATHDEKIAATIEREGKKGLADIDLLAGDPSSGYGNPLHDAALAERLWDTLPPSTWHRGSDVEEDLLRLLGRLGLRALPGLLRFFTCDAVTSVSVLARVDSPRVAPAMAQAWQKLKKCKKTAERWLLSHPETAALGLVPDAVGPAGKIRDAAEGALRLLVARGRRDAVRVAADRYGADAKRALDELLSEDALLAVPSTLPTLPSFWKPSVLPSVRLRGGGVLPPAAVDNLGIMLAVSSDEGPYAGLRAVVEACDAASLAEFAWGLFQAWWAAGASPKDEWAFLALGHIGGDEAARRLTPLIRAWPGEAAHARATRGLDVLALIGSDVALMHLHGVAERVKFKALQDRAREKMNDVASARGLSADELADRLVPDLGLEPDGSRLLSYGARAFRVGFDEQLRPLVRDGATTYADLPKPSKADDAALAAESQKVWKALKKDAKTLAQGQILRLERAMTGRRRWDAAAFRLLMVDHPLVTHLARRLVWGAWDADGRLRATFRVAEDRTLADVEDRPYELVRDWRVGIVHPLELDDVASWRRVLSDYGIIQPFLQLQRPTFSITEPERTQAELRRLEGVRVLTLRVMGLESRGWRRVLGDKCVEAYEKRSGSARALLPLEPGVSVIDPKVEPEQVLGGVNVYGEGQTPIPLGGLDPVFFSEIVGDLEFLREA